VTNYDAGARFERETRAALEDDGYEVIRSAGSKGKVDLIAWKALGPVLLIQCKRNGKISPAERAEIFRQSRLRPDFIALVASRPRVTFQRLTGVGPRDREPWTTEDALCSRS